MKWVLIASMLGFALIPSLRAEQGKAPENASGHHQSERAVHAMVRQAHTSEEYRAISESYRQLHDEFQAKANVEETEWLRRLHCTSGASAKYPTPADSAKSLYQYDKYKAAQMESLSQKYAGMAGGAPAAQSR